MNNLSIFMPVFLYFSKKIFPLQYPTIFLIITTAFISSLVTNLVISSKAEGQVKISTTPISSTPAAAYQTTNLNMLDIRYYIEHTNYNYGSEQDENIPQNTQNNSSVVFHGDRSNKQIALTFDAEMTDGMKEAYLTGQVKSWYDKRITDILNQTQTKATLFLTGMWIQLYPKDTRELAQNPLFELGSHSYSDTSYDGFCYGLKQISESQGLEDIERTQILLKDVAGVNNHMFRFPGGCYSEQDLQLVKSAGLRVVHWDITGNDGFNQDTNQIIHTIVDNVQNGSIIILHMNGAPTAPKTAEALPAIISKLKEKGFAFVKVSELLNPR